MLPLPPYSDHATPLSHTLTVGTWVRRNNAVNSAFSPPRPSPGNPSVVGVLHPPDRRKLVERGEQGPTAAELPQRAVDRRRALEPAAGGLDHPNRPADLLAAQAEPLGQPRLLVRPRIDPAGSIVALDPAREPNSKVALSVVDEDQPVIRHGPNLHCS